MIALNDRQCTQVIRGASELRLGESLPWGDREREVKAFLRDFRADWTSLHFVPFGFHPRGVPLAWPRRFLKIVEGSRVHIMFHELWIGISEDSTLKQRAIGLLQRKCIQWMVRRLAPGLVWTNTAAYSAMLKQSHIESAPITMFGHVPIETQPGQLPELPDDGELNVVIFGALHPQWPPEPLFKYLKQAVERLRRKLRLISIGNIGPGGPLWSTLAERYPEVLFLKLGMRPTSELVACFNRCHFGVSTTPFGLIGKSSSVHSMLEHGLPVIVNRLETQSSSGTAASSDPQLIICDEKLPQVIVTLPRWPKKSRLKSTADQFLAELAARA